MRMRKKKHGAERIAACSALVIHNFPLNPENIQKAFTYDINDDSVVSEDTTASEQIRGKCADTCAAVEDTVKDAVVAGDTVKDAAAAGDTVKDAVVAGDTVKDAVVAGDTVKDAAAAGDTVTDAVVAGDTVKDAAAAEDTVKDADGDTAVHEKETVTFAADSPVWLEIGCGKGAFICELAKRYPGNRLIAMERVPDVAMLAMEKCKQNGIENVRFLVGDVSQHWDMFADHTIDRIYLNFSDPWPKKGYAKRRLTHRGFLAEYRRILKPDGAIFFKTDNRGLFDFSLDEFRECGFRLENVTYDLHNSEWAADNIMTEYEKNFSEKGFSINRAEAWCQ